MKISIVYQKVKMFSKFYLVASIILINSIYARSSEFSLGSKGNQAADSAYAKLNSLLYSENHSSIYSYLQRDSILFSHVFYEDKYYNYRKLGLKLWNQFPSDKRKFEWFERTIFYGIYFNHYWLNPVEGMKIYLARKNRISEYFIPINWEEVNEWEALYPSMLSEYKLYAEKSNSMHEYNNIITNYLKTFLNFSLNKAYRKNKKMDLVQLKKVLIPAAKATLGYEVDSIWENFQSYKEFRKAISFYLVSSYKEFGLEESDIDHFFLSLERDHSVIIKRWAVEQRNVFLLLTAKSNFSLKHPSIDGLDIDFQKMRGKVILIDFWATWCTSCIDKMPSLKKMYDKLKDKGFLVISACLNNQDALATVKEINSKVGVNWPTLLIGSPSNKSSLGNEIWKKYRFWGVPQLLLFNKKGELVLINDALLNGDFEPIVRKLIMENP